MALGPVRVEGCLWDDWRLEAVADAAGYSNVYEAVGRLVRLWAWATDRGTKIVPKGAIRTIMGERGLDAMLDADLLESTPEGYRIKGSDRFESLWKRRGQPREAGRARAATAGRVAGRFVSGATTSSVATDTESPADHQRTTSGQPAQEPAGDQRPPASLISDLCTQNQIPDPRRAVGVENPLDVALELAEQYGRRPALRVVPTATDYDATEDTGS